MTALPPMTRRITRVPHPLRPCARRIQDGSMPSCGRMGIAANEPKDTLAVQAPCCDPTLLRETEQPFPHPAGVRIPDRKQAASACQLGPTLYWGGAYGRTRTDRYRHQCPAVGGALQR